MKHLDKYKKFNDSFKKAEGKLDTFADLITGFHKEISDIDTENGKIDKAMLTLRLIVESRQNKIISLFEETVTSALQEIFNENYSFKIEFSSKNKSTSVMFLLNTGEYDGYLPIKETQGKSVSDVIATVIRIMFVATVEGRKIVVLDESLSGIERDKEMAVGRFINNVSEKFNLQVIMVTHKAMVAESADNIVEI